MRATILAIAASVLVGLSGCHWMHSHGVCDCEFDDYCSSRTPWVRSTGMPPAIVNGTIPSTPSEPIPAPAPSKLPDVKTKKL